MPTPEATFRLFVYGTLKRGGVRHHVLAHCRFLGSALTRPLYALHDLGAYPGLIPHGEGQVVEGELYEVPLSLRENLDRVEGAPDWFNLAPIELQGEDGPALAYFFQQSPGTRPRLCSGRWDNQPREAAHDH